MHGLMQRLWIWYVISIWLELPVSTRMVIIALSIPEICASDYMLCLIFDCLLYIVTDHASYILLSGNNIVAVACLVYKWSLVSSYHINSLVQLLSFLFPNCTLADSCDYSVLFLPACYSAGCMQMSTILCRVLSTGGGRGEASPPNSPASPLKGLPVINITISGISR